MRLRSRLLCCNLICASGCAVTRSHIKWDYSHVLHHVCTHYPLKLTWTLISIRNSCLCGDLAILPLSPCKPTGRMPSLTKKHLRDESFQGDWGHLNATHTPWGSRVGCLAFRGYRMLCRINLGARRFFYVLPTYGLYDVLRVVTASACDHRYGLIFLSNHVFRSKK